MTSLWKPSAVVSVPNNQEGFDVPQWHSEKPVEGDEGIDSDNGKQV